MMFPCVTCFGLPAINFKITMCEKIYISKYKINKRAYIDCRTGAATIKEEIPPGKGEKSISSVQRPESIGEKETALASLLYFVCFADSHRPINPVVAVFEFSAFGAIGEDSFVLGVVLCPPGSSEHTSLCQKSAEKNSACCNEEF